MLSCAAVWFASWFVFASVVRNRAAECIPQSPCNLPASLTLPAPLKFTQAAVSPQSSPARSPTRAPTSSPTFSRMSWLPHGKLVDFEFRDGVVLGVLSKTASRSDEADTFRWALARAEHLELSAPKIESSTATRTLALQLQGGSLTNLAMAFGAPSLVFEGVSWTQG